MIDNFIERVAQRVFELLKDHVDAKFDDMRMDLERQTSEVVNLVDSNVRDQLNSVVSRVANEVTSRFRL